jgi:tRNA(Arg) A34 adenosine deaminase TadA
MLPPMTLSAFDNKILKQLMLMCEDIPRVGSGRLAACIVLKKDIVAFGINSTKTSTLMHFFNKHPEAVQIHAEIAAIHNARKRLSDKDLSKSILYIARTKIVDGVTVSGLAAPCCGCMKAIKHFGIKRVVYTE